MLEVTELHVSYGGAVRALQGVSLQVPDKKVVAVLGSNGAGKSTLLRAVSATLRLHRGAIVKGAISYHGQSLAGLDAASTVRLGIVQVPEGRRIFGRLTVEENLRAGGLGAADKRGRAASKDRVFDLFPILAERRSQRAALLSGGEQQMLAIGRALMAAPKLIILDEPSLGLAPRIVGQIGRILQAIHADGTSVLLVEQNAVMALAIADSAYVLDVGQVSLSGSAQQLAESDDVRHLYLGHAATSSSQATEEPGPAKLTRSRSALSRWQG